MFRKILIANRAEIALRLMRAARELGVPTVAIYSKADANAPHTQYAEEALEVGDAPARDSYLNIPNILAAAAQAGADAIHPGYGFLSENADFAEAVTAAGLTFIGPSAAAIRAMGDKAQSKQRMKAAGVPTVPGVEEITSLETALSAAAEIGYPVLVKASAGGGGRGMRIVHSAEEMPEALSSARREAQNAFGDERLLLEKYIQNGRHVEFQVFGDLYGNLVHLFERECSVQRRHQKIIEESPSPLLTPDLRQKMGQAALQAARAVGYTNAGTVEFIVDGESGDFYFLEMNTRLQVEHPVTELVTGLDLAQWQIRAAAGEIFPYTQPTLNQRGWALECRLYAEDVAGGFLPSTGEVLFWKEPQGAGIRVDAGVESGSRVSHFYDPMLAKIIVHAEDRPQAIARMKRALEETVVHGVETNQTFLQEVLSHPDFVAGKAHTRWVESVFAGWQPPAPPPEVLALADLPAPEVSSAAPGKPFDPWG